MTGFSAAQKACTSRDSTVQAMEPVGVPEDFLSCYIPIMEVKSAIISDILICWGQTCSQLLQPTQLAGCFSSGMLPTAMGAMKPPPVALCSLYRAISSGMGSPFGQWLVQ